MTELVEALVRSADDFEAHLRRFIYDRSEESRAVRVGEKGVSEQAEIVACYADLFTREQLEALHQAEDAAETFDGRERLHRLRKTCQAGIVARQLAPLQDALANAELAARVEFAGEKIPLRAAIARLGVLASYAEREELGASTMDVSATLNDQRLELARAGEILQAELSGEADPVARTEQEKQVSLRQLVSVLDGASTASTHAYEDLLDGWLDRLLGPAREARPSSYQTPYLVRLSPLADVYTKEHATDVCLATLKDLGFDLARHPNIQTDVEDRPQKAPRPAVIASDPPTIVHLITRPLGGLPDYQSFLHEAGHALHFAGCDPTHPYAFRALSRDYALTEIYSYIVQHITLEPGWHARYFGLTAKQAAENAQAVRLLDTFFFRRMVAKLQFELDFWSRFSTDGGTPRGYVERLNAATGFSYRADRFLADMDPGFYSADYLRAWIRSAQLRSYLRKEVGEDWWCRSETGDFLRPLFREGLRPSNEAIAERLGFAPFDVGPLVAERT